MTVTAIGSIYRYSTDRRSWASGERVHHILSYQLSGHYDHDFGDRVLAVKEGSLFFIRRDEGYTVTRQKAGEAICVTLAMEDPPPSTLFDCLEEPRVENLFRKLYTLRHIEAEETRCAAMSVVYELLSILAARRTPVYQKSDAASRLLEAEHYIHTHFRDGEISVGALASLCGLGKKQFTTLFAGQYHTTPAQYVIDLRLRSAAALLREGLSVAATAEAVGFSDTYYFSRLFKKRFFLPPSHYARSKEKNCTFSIKNR